MKKNYIIRTFWDDEAKVWVASSENFIGIATEAKTLDKLVKKLEIMVPEILEANGYIKGNFSVPSFELISQHQTSCGHNH